MLHNGYTFAEISDIMKNKGVKGCGREISMPNDYGVCNGSIYCDKCVDDYYNKHLSTVKKERVEIGYCKDCKHKDMIDGKNICTCKSIHEDKDWSNESEINNSDNLTYSYCEGGCFYVGDNFGCVHYI